MEPWEVMGKIPKWNTRQQYFGQLPNNSTNSTVFQFLSRLLLFLYSPNSW